MKFIRKMNQFLIENYPLIWHSKSIQLFFAGVFLWLISYLTGYLLTNVWVITSSSLDNLYFSSYYVSFHLIYGLIVLCFWAISFYKNNAFKAFYPLQRFYFMRLFMLLFVGFTLLISAYVPFSAGAKLKFRSQVDSKSYMEDMRKLNLGYVFLVQNVEKYSLFQRDDLASEQVGFLKFDANKNQWEEASDGNYYYYYPDLMDKKYISTNLNKLSKSIDVKKYNVNGTMLPDYQPTDTLFQTKIDDKIYQFFSYETKYDSEDSCSYNRFIKQFYKLNQDGKLHLKAVENFRYPVFKTFSADSRTYFKEKQLPKIQAWVRNNQKDSIQKAIQQFEDVCLKYGIGVNLQPALIANYLELKSYAGFTNTVVNEYISEIKDFEARYPEMVEVLQKYQSNLSVAKADSSLFIEAMHSQPYNFYDAFGVQYLMDNFQFAYHKNVFEFFIGFFIAAFAITAFFVLFEFTNIVSLLIAIPVTGVISILVGLLLIIINLNRVYAEDYNSHTYDLISIVIVVVIMTVILAFTIFGLYNKRFNKKVLNVLFNMSYFIAPAYLTCCAVLMNLSSGKYVYNYCNSEYVYSMDFLLTPTWVLVYLLVGLFSFFYFIKKWKAREE